MQKYQKFLHLRLSTSTCRYVCGMWLWENQLKLLYFLQVAGMFVHSHYVTLSIMVFHHFTSNNKCYFKEYFDQEKICSLRFTEINWSTEEV